MQCPNGCTTSMKSKKEERIFHRHSQPVVISDLTIYMCPQCGQESMPLSSAKMVEDILNEKVKPSGKFTAELYRQYLLPS